jgi:quinol monooxygenase YgiN
MVTQVRIYTVNRGMLDAWVEHFNTNIVPTSAKFGIRVLGAWVNRPQNEFVWVRTFESDEVLQKYQDSPERATYTAKSSQLLAKTEFRNVEDVLRAPVGTAT